MSKIKDFVKKILLKLAKVFDVTFSVGEIKISWSTVKSGQLIRITEAGLEYLPENQPEDEDLVDYTIICSPNSSAKGKAQILRVLGSDTLSELAIQTAIFDAFLAAASAEGYEILNDHNARS